jgi:hypothetical protein
MANQWELSQLPFHLYLTLAATPGARRGELLALRWLDVDLPEGTSRSSAQLSKVLTARAGADQDPLLVSGGARSWEPRAFEGSAPPWSSGSSPGGEGFRK